MFPALHDYISALDIKSIPEKRKNTLRPLVNYVKEHKNNKVRLNFICTHNSRRSQFSQIWGQTLAHYFNLKNVFCYSAGTEATSFFPMVIETLQNSGFIINELSGGINPIYTIKYDKNELPVIGFSKTLDNEFNPTSEFAAVMTCDSANETCPFVPGAEIRIPITFKDPKAFDNTPHQAEKYMERNRQIATELFYVFAQINP